MGKQYDLSDEQWCFLDLMMRARQRGIRAVSRLELLHSKELPQEAALKLAWAGLTMPKELVRMEGQHTFIVTEEGVSLYNLRFGRHNQPAQPTAITDAVICLPGPDHYKN